MQIERALTGVTALGPGKRLVLWVNGCKRRCKGCVSARLQAPEPRNERDVVAFLGEFDLDCDGVTVSGGEPFDQAEELLRAVRFLRERGIADILVYTGYTLAELRAMHDGTVEEILDLIAVLIDGPYVEALDSGKGNLKGSDNQNILFLKEEFRPRYEGYLREERRMQEFRIGNYVIAAGIPTRQYIEDFTSNTKKNGG